MARPNYTYSGSGNKFTFALPPGWYAMVSSLSRKAYDQGMRVSFAYMGELNEAMFYSPAHKSMEQMKMTFNEQNSLSIVPQDEEMLVEVRFYGSPKAPLNGDQLIDRNMNSKRIHVVKSEKTPGAFEGGIDYMTFFMFVEDTNTTSVNSGSYDDAVGLVHLLKSDA